MFFTWKWNLNSLTRASKKHCQVFTCPLQTTPSIPNGLVPRKDSWGLREGAPYISPDVCSRAAEGECQTLSTFSSVSASPSLLRLPSLLQTPWVTQRKGNREQSLNTTLCRYQRHSQRRQSNNCQEFLSYLDLKWHSKSQVCIFDT